MTNSDRIRNMTDEELSLFFDDVMPCSVCVCCGNLEKCSEARKKASCRHSILEWLKQEVEDEQT